MSLPIRYSLRNLSARRARSLLTMTIIALTVLAVTMVLSLISGIRQTIVAAGDSRNVVVLRKGADNEGASWIGLPAYQVVRGLDGIERSADGEPLVSGELVVQPFLTTKAGRQENVLVRGVAPLALRLHEHVRIVAGRMFQPGLDEAIVGRSAAARYAGAQLGSQLRFGRRSWKVVGIFEDGRSLFESEIWTDAAQLADDSGKALPFSAIYLRVGGDAHALIQRIDNDPRLGLRAQLEPAFYAKRADSANALYAIVFLLAALAGGSAMFGTANSLHASVQARTTEIGTLRALGFSRWTITRSFVLEAALTGLAGFLAGALGALALAAVVARLSGGVGVPTSTFTTLVVDLRVGGGELLAAFLLAAAIALIASVGPARRVASLRPTEALHRF
jgi:putative ABC transport system permease protein